MALSPTLFPSPSADGVTEQHVHLGGCVSIYRLWEMGQIRGIRGLGSYEEFVRLAHRRPDTITSLDDYLRVFDLVEAIQSGPDSVRESIHVAVSGAYRTAGMRQLGPGGEGADLEPPLAVRKLELRLCPLKRTGAPFLRGEHAGLYDLDRIVMAACQAAAETELIYRGEMRVGLIFCFGRDLTWEANAVLAAKTRHWRSVYPNIIGVDLAGSERVCPLSDPEDRARMRELFEEAAGNDAGSLGRTIHCGETPFVDLETFIATVNSIEPQRVAHPLAAAHAYWQRGDARGLRLLAERDITCELCPWSNHLTGALPIERSGALLRLLDEFHIGYTISTDSPALQKTSLALEIELLLSRGEVKPEQISRAFAVAEATTFLKRA
jgi:adenosine/AMP deaminase-like protein